jgi:protein gp37
VPGAVGVCALTAQYAGFYSSGSIWRKPVSKVTNIQWCDSTCNPTMGCDGCELWSPQRKTCYAGMLHTRFGGTNPGYAPRFDKVKLFPGRMAEAAAWSDLSRKQRKAKPWLDDMPRMIFVSDMSDALSKRVSFSFLHREIVAVAASELGHRCCPTCRSC